MSNVFEASAVPPGAFDDTGVRVNLDITLRSVRRGTRLNTTLNPRVPVLGMPAGGDRWVRLVEFRGANIRIDFTDTLTGPPIAGGAIGPQDLPEDSERHWAWGLRNNANRSLWGGFFLRDDTTRTTGGGITGDEPYITDWPEGEDFNSFALDYDATDPATQIYRLAVWDGRPANVAGDNFAFRTDTGLREGSYYRWQVAAENSDGVSGPSDWSLPVGVIGEAPHPLFTYAPRAIALALTGGDNEPIRNAVVTAALVDTADPRRRLFRRAGYPALWGLQQVRLAEEAGTPGTYSGRLIPNVQIGPDTRYILTVEGADGFTDTPFVMPDRAVSAADFESIVVN